MIALRRPAAVFAALALSASVALVAVTSTDSAGASTSSGAYNALTPTRIFDSRAGFGAIGPKQEVILTVAGVSINGVSVPNNASAVAVNVTVTQPSRNGYITVFPATSNVPPTASNLNFNPGQTVPNLVVVGLSSDGKIRLYNGSTGTVHLIVDEFGYFTGSNAPVGQGSFGSITPLRVLDTRNGTGAPRAIVGPMSSVAFSVLAGGVPAGASAVVMNVTVNQPTAAGYVTAYADGASRPTVSNLNYLPGQTVPNLVVAKVGSDGRVVLFNGSHGSTHLIADVAGYFLPGDPISLGTFGTVPPLRMLDTRSGIGGSATPLGPHETRTFQISGVLGSPGLGGIPISNVAGVVMNVTALSPTANGFLTVYGPNPLPGVSNLNYNAGINVPNLVFVQPGAAGTVKIYNGSPGSVQVLADVSGYFLGADAPLPAVSVGHYVRNITGASTDFNTMFAEGCNDARAGSTLVLLDIGAQSTSNTPPSANGVVLSATNPGVRLTALNPPVRLTYAQLVSAVNAYTQGFAYPTCYAPANATIAVGTNSNGDFTSYPATAMGADWASMVMDALTPRTGLNLVAANDIEAGFGAKEGDVATWEVSYLAKTTKNLIYNGSLDNCPTTYGSTDECGAVAGQNGPNWTRSNYVSLTHGFGPGRISVLPQIYF
ncbi:MAG: hypothetical protein M3O32_23140, partial [Actinomycetota bacterium]|nr:hypothetical protein [Actinomycetota bacterium]